MKVVRVTATTAGIIAFLAGVLLPFSFAPTEWWLIAPLSLAVFYSLLQARTPRQGLLIGWLFGLGYFGLGVSWVYHSVHLFGAAIAPLAAFITLLFVLVMTVFPTLVGWLFIHLRRARNPLLNTLLFASLWVLAELARGKIMGGFPWILVGYSQTAAPLGAMAPVIGVYGISFVVVLLSANLLLLVQGPLLRTRVCAIAIVASAVLAGILLDRIEWSQPKAEQLQVRMVQANIPQAMKFSRERLNHALQQYVSLTTEKLSDVDLVVWPETAIPTYFDRLDEVLKPTVDRLDTLGIGVLSGGFYRDGDDVYNSVRQLGGDRLLYRKRHLVPFGEFMPFRFILDHVARFVEIPMSDLSAGSGPHEPIHLQGESIGLSICYEDVYGEEMRALLPASTLLINVSNDAWFGDSAAPHQHEQKARMRAREFARPLVRVTNTGVSSSIDYRGRVQARIAHNTQGVLDVAVLPRTGTTPYAATGNYPIAWVALLVVGLMLAFRQSA